MDKTVVWNAPDGTPITSGCRLVVTHGPMPGDEVELRLGVPVRVGKDDQATLRILDPAVSRHHFTITAQDDGFLVEDVGSTNGTYVGGIRVERALLVPGSVLRAGGSTLRILPEGKAERLRPSPRTQFGDLLGPSKAMREVFALVERIAPSDVTILLQGETGTGKELAARSIHAHSQRAAGPLVVFDCAAVAPTLIESELFGHSKGAFTGAISAMPGVFERAQGGTVLIDEIGDLPLTLQPRLLRVLDARVIKRLGSTRDRPVDVRVIAATHLDLVKMVRAGHFRDDLYYRLSVVEVILPPLRNRLEDLVPLIQHFLAAAGWPPDVEVGGPGLELLDAHHWPGNVRELRNVIDRAVSLASGPGVPFEALRIEIGRLGRDSIGPVFDPSVPFRQGKAAAIAAFEAEYLGALMERHGGNVSKAARAAEMDRGHLRTLLRQHGLLRR